MKFVYDDLNAWAWERKRIIMPSERGIIGETLGGPIDIIVFSCLRRNHPLRQMTYRHDRRESRA